MFEISLDASDAVIQDNLFEDVFISMGDRWFTLNGSLVDLGVGGQWRAKLRFASSCCGAALNEWSDNACSDYDDWKHDQPDYVVCAVCSCAYPLGSYWSSVFDSNGDSSADVFEQWLFFEDRWSGVDPMAGELGDVTAGLDGYELLLFWVDLKGVVGDFIAGLASTDCCGVS